MRFVRVWIFQFQRELNWLIASVNGNVANKLQFLNAKNKYKSHGHRRLAD